MENDVVDDMFESELSISVCWGEILKSIFLKIFWMLEN